MTSVVLLDVGHGNCAIVRSGDATAVVDCPTGSILLDTLIDLGVEVGWRSQTLSELETSKLS